MWYAVVDDQLVGPFILEGSSYRRGVPQISEGGFAPTIEGCAFK